MNVGCQCSQDTFDQNKQTKQQQQQQQTHPIDSEESNCLSLDYLHQIHIQALGLPLRFLENFLISLVAFFINWAHLI